MMIVAAISLSSFGSATGSAVLHFLWQGALIGLAAWMLLGALRQRPAAERYAVAGGAMLLCLLSFSVSFATALTDVPLVGGTSAQLGSAQASGGMSSIEPESDATRVAAWCWAIGALFMALRFTLQCYGAQRLKSTAVFEPDPSWKQAFESLKRELGISRPVRLLRSGLADVPMVVGWFSPVVLVPASAFTGLSPDQLRSLLAHELAHIRRYDHLLNAAQAAVEIVLFFHPVVWWLSTQVRLEREYCCDDSSVRLTGDPRLVAEALATMETLRLTDPTSQIVLAANGGPLMQRITRILGSRLDGRAPLTSWHLPAGFVLAGVLALAGGAYATPALTVDGDAVAQQTDRAEAKQVWAELEAAVKAGTITEAQAKERFEGYLKHLDEKKKKAQEAERAEAERVWAELEAGVKAGKITEAQAKERFEGYLKHLEQKNKQRETDRAAPEKIWAKLEAAVKAGEITEAQAKERFADFRKKQAQRDAVETRESPAAVIKKIEAAVEAGRLTPEQGKERIKEYEKRLAEERAQQRAAFEGFVERIEAAVAAGEMTPDEGKAQIANFKKRLALGIAPRRTLDVEAAIKRIAAAVESGRITPEQGKERIEALKKSVAEQKDVQRKEDSEAVIKKIEAAVKAGHLTPEEGKARIEAYKKSLKSDKKSTDRR